MPDPTDSAAETPTEPRPPVIEEAPRPAQDNDAEDVTRDMGRYLHGRCALVARLMREHRAATAALALIAVACVVLLAMALSRAGAVPSSEDVAADARASFSAPDRAAGTFDAPGALVTQDVDVRSVTRSQSAPEGMGPQFGASGYAAAEVVITYSGPGVRAQRGATLGYALVNEAWTLVGSSDNGLSWEATSGVDSSRTRSAAGSLLEQAAQAPELDGLLDVYVEASASVGAGAFDEEAQTDRVELTWKREGAFESFACRMSVSFAFSQAAGTWEVSGIEVAEGALVPSLEKTVGTWRGTFQSQETDGNKCLAARGTGLAVTIERVETSAGVTRATGTVTGLAHYHARPGRDAESCEGDATFEAVPFTATRAEDEGDDAAGTVVFEATLPEDVGGTVGLTLSFGDSEDPGRVTARVETAYPTTGTIFFIPYEETLTYTDAFLLARTE